MRKTDISGYTDISENPGTDYSGAAGHAVKNVFRLIWKTILTLIAIMFVACVIIGISMIMYVASIAREPTGIDLHSTKLNMTSYVYIYDDKGNPKEYKQLYSSENRVMVDFEDIPKYMKDAIVAIEDKRFYEHHGVDWLRTAKAIFTLSTGGSQFGGSTLTQQLIKNITSDNDVSITRKLKEIFRALNLEREFTKDEILESYLNTVNFGGNNNGIQAAATAYFNKDVKDLTLAECAAIVGITQNPSQYNPLYFPEENRERRETVLYAMLEQGKITQEEYDEAMEESATMTFADPNTYIEEETEEVSEDEIQNWYMDALFEDLRRDLAEYLDISEEAASMKLYTEGLKIYCAMDLDLQEQMEKMVREFSYFSYYPELECGFCMMDYDGKVISIVGSNKEKTTNLAFSRATDAELQPGSTIKGVAAYPLAIQNGNLYFSSIVHDVPIDNWFAEDGRPGPNNWYMSYNGDMLLPDAIEISSNATVANVLKDLVDPNGQDGVRYSYDYVTNKLGWSHLDFEQDSVNLGGLSIGGFYRGVTVEEMAKAYTLLGNGGKSYKPYTYYYITDYEDNVIIDNRDQDPIQALTAETAAIMNRLLHYNIQNSHSTNAGETRITGWDIIGKTGTTDADKDSWFCGNSPYAAAAVWVGYDESKTVEDTTIATKLWKVLMEYYLNGKEKKEYTFPNDLIVAQYCPYTGLLANTGCGAGHYGYYDKNNLPMYCTYHAGYNTEYTTWGELYEQNAQAMVSEQAVTSQTTSYGDYDYNNNGNNSYNYSESSAVEENYGGESGGETGSGEIGGGETGSGEIGGGETGSGEIGGGETGGGEVGGGETGGGEVGGGEVGGGETGGGETGGGEVGGGETGGGEIGGGEVPVE